MGGTVSSPTPNLASVLEGVGTDMRLKFPPHLAEMTEKKVRFRNVAIWRQAFLGGTIDHHTVVYEYKGTGGRQMSLALDWGREGLSFTDSAEDPCTHGDVLERKWLPRLPPDEVLKHWEPVKDLVYVLATWNCQHFSRYMYDLADSGVSDRVAVDEPEKGA
eukprot:TRINITY_DN43856_c0_g1_i1.p1 TRINITY_DN43856_c0_g1~~TRINITY_DN43856_c0_g1_i1.p1  ORF type:complete len:175 (+),score=28.35 TRINITY_DN43856_c0_g1_i1:45-527(+)